MKNLFCFFLTIISTGLVAQKNGVLSGTGNRSKTAHWSPSIPHTSMDVNTSIGANIFVDAIGECNDLSLLLSSVTINRGATLTIYGQDSATTIGSNIKRGTLILKGTLRLTAGGSSGITVGNGGGLTTVDGMTFSTYSID
ncbi:MAG: hypothetical protein ACI9DK_000214 [Vicingaceae bacterium]|jgi:hypothetical protein